MSKTKKLRELTKEEAEILCYKVDNEGMAYAVKEGYCDFPGTTIQPVVDKAKKAMKELEACIEQLKEEHEIEDA